MDLDCAQVLGLQDTALVEAEAVGIELAAAAVQASGSRHRRLPGQRHLLSEVHRNKHG